MKHTTKLRQLIERDEILVCPGTYDPLMAKLISRVGFEAIYMTGAGISHSTLAMPDLGLTTMTEMVHRATLIADAAELPLICDADTGYGNAINVMRTVREYERAGVAGIHIEDQEMPKRCGHFFGKSLVPTEEMVGKLKAASTPGRTRISSSSPEPMPAPPSISTKRWTAPMPMRKRALT